MNEEEFRKLFRRTLGEPAPSDLRSRLEAGLSARRSRPFSSALGLIAATLWLLIVAGLLGWRLYERATSPATVKPSTPATVSPTSAVDPSNCRLPVIVNATSGPQMATEVGFVDTRTGQYAKDGAASIAGLPGGAFEGTGVKPSLPAAPAYYSGTARRWLPVSGGVAPDGQSYVWVRLLPEGSNLSNFKKSELHRYDLTPASDRTLWSYEGTIDVWRWDTSGILVHTVPTGGGSLTWWRIDPLSGTVTQQPPSADPGRFTELPGDRQNDSFSYSPVVNLRGPTIFRIGSRQADDQEWIFYESAPGQRVTIYKGKQGDATGFDPFRAMWEGKGIWFGDYQARLIWHWQQDTGLRKINVKGLPTLLPGEPSGVDPAGQCMSQS